jgi:hypothetical protein
MAAGASYADPGNGPLRHLVFLGGRGGPGTSPYVPRFSRSS